ncbi:Rieske (2Fe-2S) protein [Bordetella holmesii]|uniref:Rieske domain protein n=2 Tax=Bordetella holmesii TaxID=35814 RepID=A0ABP3BPV6_9BORD|nr:Rieske 2Fe-2S domain-containing protein [Bordetella holmesii]AHV93452.1 rieske domain protein [Bordetella holmesii ATCC 51541]AIT26192.1 rieske domain protein [Bordetella holmesii 44057]EWM42742.1 rieske domain protein [Bordetella holmesii 41130]EWM46764.1 rieske domain protein [Bordetella holmesii 35009]EWM50931.1 rieske domain protein [Bordetella holmesii 70147]
MSEASTKLQWHEVSHIDDIWEGEMTGVEVNGKKVLLINTDGDIHAYHDRCPHQQWPLHDGDLSDGVLTCAQHLWQFDVTTAKGINPSTCQLHKYPCQVDDSGNIQVSVE